MPIAAWGTVRQARQLTSMGRYGDHSANRVAAITLLQRKAQAGKPMTQFGGGK